MSVEFGGSGAAIAPDGGLALLGPPMQIAFVPEDFDAALDFWVRRMGVGPFFALPHVALTQTRYLDVPAEIDFSIMIAYWGELQIELIRQHNDAPSIFTAWRACGLHGVHHVCVLTEDMDEARARCAAAGARIVQQALVPGGGEVIYAETGGGPGTLLEVLKPAPGGRDAFAAMRAAARGWDGRDPVRALG